MEDYDNRLGVLLDRFRLKGYRVEEVTSDRGVSFYVVSNFIGHPDVMGIFSKEWSKRNCLVWLRSSYLGVLDSDSRRIYDELNAKDYLKGSRG